MVSETIIGIVIFTLINIVGWAITLRIRKSSNTKSMLKESKEEGAMEAKILGSIKTLGEKIQGLPCVYDKEYMTKMGGLQQKVDDLCTDVSALNSKVDKLKPSRKREKKYG